MSVIYGTDALAGVITITRKRDKEGINIGARLQEESVGKDIVFTRKGVHNLLTLGYTLKSLHGDVGFTHNGF